MGREIMESMDIDMGNDDDEGCLIMIVMPRWCLDE